MSNDRTFLLEAEVVEGLEDIAAEELLRYSNVHPLVQGTGYLKFELWGAVNVLHRLRSVEALFLVEQFDVPRPKALLGHQHFERIVRQIQTAISSNKQPFTTMSLSAAGEESAVMQRLVFSLSERFKLKAEEKGDLLIRIKREKNGGLWEVLVRTTPRPLVTRPWRVRNLPGALNATVANAMVRMTNPTTNDIFVNLMSGSGTIAIERGNFGAKAVIGVESDLETIILSQDNITAAELPNSIHLLHGDATVTGFSNHSIDSICIDLPFGHQVGSIEANVILYPQVLAEVARILKPSGRCVIITHAIQQFEDALRKQTSLHVESMTKITLRGLHPRIYCLSNQRIS
jgi:tRNA (guanine6-N2)-methyltransferase